MRFHCARLSGSLLLIVAGSSFASGHELLVGRVADQIVMRINGSPPFDLPESEFEGFDGFAAVEPGFVALPADLGDGSLFAMPPEADLEWTLLSATPHILVLNDDGAGYMNIGDTYNLGMPLFHVHPLWHSPNGTPGEIYSITMRLHDRAGVLADSAVYTVDFMPVPEPTCAALLLLGTCLFVRRR